MSGDSDDPRQLIPQLCRQFYDLGWVSGTGGGMSIRKGDHIYIAPSGVQKERIQSDELFVIDMNEEVLERPDGGKNLRQSECQPLFMAAYRLRGAGAVVHSHSLNAVLATLVTDGNEFRITHQEMIKGIKKGSTNESHRFDDTLVVPIIENTPFEKDLTDQMVVAINSYPNTNAVLVRRHGLYVWGLNWKSAKTMAECYDYLFKVAVQMKSLGLDPNKH
ncbi:methylthioribulose-1-phosphate dehydratase-like [Oppia nitens]|uniref:methylthioribulose-1-phosphate dehydratase-like n=1 Tax=Oppia nitens TaxID=1686743 RepID=UPI0023DC4A52|nr:methylthioribulose-1-phosphate dehydratase-like [Oppia nitens]